MLKKHGQLYLSTLFFSDSVAIVISWLAAYYVRFDWQFFALRHPIPPLELYLWALIPVWAVFMLNIKLCRLYEPATGAAPVSAAVNIIKVVSISILMLTAVTFFYRGESFSRIVTGYFWLFSILALLLSHASAKRLMALARARGFQMQRVLIVGNGKLARQVAKKIAQRPEIGFQVVGFLKGKDSAEENTLDGLPVLGGYLETAELIREQAIDQLFVALPLSEQETLKDVLAQANQAHVDIRVVPDLLEFMNLQAGVEDFDGLPIVNLTQSPLTGWNRVIKRATDIVVASVLLLVSAPFLGLVAALIKLDSKGPVLFRQKRAGLDGKTFEIVKFRSMWVGAEGGTGPVWTVAGDPRRTRVGAFLRRTSLDELPQLFNVLKGEMSLVGPRPERPVFIAEFKKSIPHYALRLKVKAGLTGWAQVNGWRGDTCLNKRVECDLYYMDNWSWWFDLKILCLTLWRGLFNRHAY